MALVTKQYLYETIQSLLEGGSPSTGKKFERQMVQAHLQQAINRKLKTEYLSVTLPSDETIPEGLVIAAYDNIPVTQYKGLSRAKLPASPISLRRNMGVYFVGPAFAGNIIPPVPDLSGLVIIETVTGVSIIITGTTDTVYSAGAFDVIGIAVGATSITCAAFVNKTITIIRGNVPIPGINPGDGSNYFTHALGSDTIFLSSPLVLSEFLKITATPLPVISTYSIIESVIGTSIVITGFAAIVSGLAAGSTVISSSFFGGKYVNVIRGNVPLPGINPTDGSNYFTKPLVSNDITLSSPLVAGEFIKIQTL